MDNKPIGTDEEEVFQDGVEQENEKNNSELSEEDLDEVAGGFQGSTRGNSNTIQKFRRD